jgi:hypothetical protein
MHMGMRGASNIQCCLANTCVGSGYTAIVSAVPTCAFRCPRLAVFRCSIGRHPQLRSLTRSRAHASRLVAHSGGIEAHHREGARERGDLRLERHEFCGPGAVLLVREGRTELGNLLAARRLLRRLVRLSDADGAVEEGGLQRDGQKRGGKGRGQVGRGQRW